MIPTYILVSYMILYFKSFIRKDLNFQKLLILSLFTNVVLKAHHDYVQSNKNLIISMAGNSVLNDIILFMSRINNSIEFKS